MNTASCREILSAAQHAVRARAVLARDDEFAARLVLMDEVAREAGLAVVPSANAPRLSQYQLDSMRRIIRWHEAIQAAPMDAMGPLIDAASVAFRAYCLARQALGACAVDDQPALRIARAAERVALRASQRATAALERAAAATLVRAREILAAAAVPIHPAVAMDQQ